VVARVACDPGRAHRADGQVVQRRGFVTCWLVTSGGSLESRASGWQSPGRVDSLRPYGNTVGECAHSAESNLKIGPRPARFALAAIAALALGGALLAAIGSALVAPAPAAIPDSALAVSHQAVSFPSQSGSTIHGWYVPGSPAGGTVVLMHGIRANRLSMANRVGFLHSAGYAVLLFDFQGHGESTGRYITLGHLEALDAMAAVAYARQQQPGFVAAVGTSLGGAAALLGPSPLPVDALLLEAVYTTIDKAVQNRLHMRLGVIGEWLAPLLLLQLKPRLGINVTDLSPLERIKQASAPLLIIGGAEDRHTTVADTQLLFDAAPQPKSLWIIPGAAHVDFAAYAGEEYETRLLSFFGGIRK
jgi:uncharacterized protein